MLKLINLNIEGDQHLPQVIEFLKKEKAEVVCLQEVLKDNIPALIARTDYQVKFFPMTRVVDPTIWAQSVRGEAGVAILTKLKIIQHGSTYYFGGIGEMPTFNVNDFTNVWRILAWIEIEKDSQKYLIANTHFTWTPEGKSTPKQFQDLENLLKILDNLGEFVLCGDFNAPRGGEIWNELAKRYQDNIPPDIKTTIDPKLHRVGPLQLVVDGLFSTPKYQVENVKVVSGLSDHQAVVGEITCP